MISNTEISAMIEDPTKFSTFIEEQTDKDIVFVLNRLGHLGSCSNKDGFRESLCKLLKSNNSTIRMLSVKNLAKYNDISMLNTFLGVLHNDASTEVKREAVSAIGRMRNEKNIDILESLLSSKDPEIVLQAIRGLLPFKSRDHVRNTLRQLIDHPNEMVQNVINREIITIVKQTLSNKNSAIASPPYLQNLVIHGDSIQAMKLLPSESIHLTFTSPPYYNARDYSIYQSYEEYLDFIDNAFKEVFRLTKEGRFFILNTSPIIIKRVSRQYSSKRYPIPYDIHHRLMKMGWEFIDDIVWVKPEESVKNRVAGFDKHRKPLAYKPNVRTECIMVYRKKTDKLIDWNIRSYPYKTVNESRVKEDYETSNVWFIDPTFDKTHSAVFPIELCNRVIKLYSYLGDLVFDPFGGSGTFAKSALLNSRNFLICEVMDEYIGRIEENLTPLCNDDHIVRYHTFEELKCYLQR